MNSNPALPQNMNQNIRPDGVVEYAAQSQNSSDPQVQIGTGEPVMNVDEHSQNLDSKIQAASAAVGSPAIPVVNANQDQSNPQISLTLETIFMNAVQMEGSDIHLTVGYRVIIRIHGELKVLNSHELTENDLLHYVKVLTADRTDVVIDEIKELDIGYAIQGKRFRVNIFRQMGRFSIVARVVPDEIKTTDELGLPQLVKEIGNLANGLVLVTGPTGSGKSTTIASILNSINTYESKHIVTLEDPIEFVYPKGRSLIDQREFGMDFDSWDHALKSLLRQDPDVVLVGEMRDLETIGSTITVSETGHLVFATLHTNSAAQSIDRIIDVFPEAQQAQVRAQLATVINAVISQRLVPVKAGGRKAVLEIMLGTAAVKNSIREGKTHLIDNLIQTGQDIGMMSLESNLAKIVQTGEITVDVARSFSNKPAELDVLLRN